MLRFAGASLCHLVLFAAYRGLGMAAPPVAEASRHLTAGAAAVAALAFVLPIVLRGRPPEKVAAVGLCLFPLTILTAIVWHSFAS